MPAICQINRASFWWFLAAGSGKSLAMLDFFSKYRGLMLVALGVACFALPALAAEKTADYDNRYAVIFAYFGVGNDESPSSSVTADQFRQQVEELSSGPYTFLPLPDIAARFAAGKTLSDRTVAITFDGADQSVRDIAAPLLVDHKIPFSIFIPADKITDGKPPYMSWGDLRALKKTGLVTFGLHPASYSKLSGASVADIRREINNSLSKIREELDVEPTLFAYPFGEYDPAYESIIRGAGLRAGFGQQSGVAYAGGDLYALPRFTLTERYGDLDRFIMAANALPLPVKDLSPLDPSLKTLTPSIGFTVPDDLSKTVKKISCFASSDEKPEMQFINTRVEMRMGTIDEERLRINCTLPVTAQAGEEARWRWLGMMYTLPADLLNPVQPERHAGDQPDSINME